jgi:pimeloyl-ACP methyl ester carboxylesterase
MRRSSTVLAVVALGITALTAGPAVADNHAGAKEGALIPQATNLSWQECGDQFKGGCTTIKVPIDWSKPDQGTFDLAVGRLPAKDPANRLGVLFLNPGGPGGSGIDRYIVGRGISDDSILRQRFDLISWDPRGVKRSHPVQCSQDLLNEAPTDYPKTEADYQHLLSYNATLGADCRANTGPLFDHVDTVSTVRDVDAIRAALGEQKISYLGFSYGTQIGQQYAELFPNRIRAMTIDSNMDHSITSVYQYLETTTHDFEASFNAFADWCARTTSCALHGQDVRAVWDDLYLKAGRGELTDPATGEPITEQGLRLLAFDQMYVPGTAWPTLATDLAGLAAGSKAARTRTPAPARHAELGTNPYQAIWCEDWSWRVSGFSELQQYRSKLEKLAPHTRMAEFWGDITSCLGWPTKVTNPQHKLSIDTPAPILITASKYDVGTPHAWSAAVAAQDPAARFLNYDGVGHAVYRLSPCAKNHIETFLTTLRLPEAGTHCPAVWPGENATTDHRSPTKPVHTT